MNNRLHLTRSGMRYCLTAGVLWATTFLESEAQSVATLDSAKKTAPSRYNWRLTTRLHSLGYFSFTGRLNSSNPAADANFTIENKQWGATVIKVSDLLDHRTDNNFAIILLYRNFRIGKRWTITPNAAGILEQQSGVADKGSDLSFLLITSYKISPTLTIDHTSIFTNLVFDRAEKDWINRVRLLYSKKHWDVTLLAWQNNKVLDPTEYYSGGVTVYYSRVPVSPHVLLSAGLTGVKMPHSSHPDEFPPRNGILLTLVCVVH